MLRSSFYDKFLSQHPLRWQRRSERSAGQIYLLYMYMCLCLVFCRIEALKLHHVQSKLSPRAWHCPFFSFASKKAYSCQCFGIRNEAKKPEKKRYQRSFRRLSIYHENAIMLRFLFQVLIYFFHFSYLWGSLQEVVCHRRLNSRFLDTIYMVSLSPRSTISEAQGPRFGYST